MEDLHNIALNEIGLKYGTDKSTKEHNYLTFYEKRLSALRNDKFVMFEIGVLNGGSLKTWGEYFQNATIVGMDINPDVAKFAAENKHILIADASRGETADEATNKFGRPLIVLDDGSHYWHHQIESLRYFWPKILPGGMFIMEDLHTSFEGMYNVDPTYIGDSEISAYEYIMKLNRVVTAGGFLGAEKPFDGFISNYASSVSSIEWYAKTCIINKKI